MSHMSHVIRSYDEKLSSDWGFSRIWIEKFRQLSLKQARRGGGGRAVGRNQSESVNIALTEQRRRGSNEGATTERAEGGHSSILAGFLLALFFEQMAVLRFA